MISDDINEILSDESLDESLEEMYNEMPSLEEDITSNVALELYGIYSGIYDMVLNKDDTLIIHIPIKDYTCKVMIDGSNTICPRLAILSPRYDMDGIIPIRPSGMVVIDGLTPSTYKGNSKDIIPILVDMLQKLPYPVGRVYHTELLKSDFKLLKDTNVVSYMKVESVFALDTDNDVQGNCVYLSEDLLDEMGKIGLTNTFLELETNLGLKTYCHLKTDNSYKDQWSVYLPPLVKRNLLITDKEDAEVHIKVVYLPTVTYFNLSDIDHHYIVNTEDSRVVKDTVRTHYHTLNRGEIIQFNGVDLLVRKTKPANNVSTITTDTDETVVFDYTYNIDNIQTIHIPPINRPIYTSTNQLKGRTFRPYDDQV